MTDMLVEQSKSSLTVQLWEFELWWCCCQNSSHAGVGGEQQHEDERYWIQPVGCSTHQRSDLLLFSIQKSLMGLRNLPAAWLSSSRRCPAMLLSLWEVLIKVVPKVLQGFWVTFPSYLNMLSQQISEMAVTVTEVVLDQDSAGVFSMISSTSPAPPGTTWSCLYRQSSDRVTLKMWWTTLLMLQLGKSVTWILQPCLLKVTFLVFQPHFQTHTGHGDGNQLPQPVTILDKDCGMEKDTELTTDFWEDSKMAWIISWIKCGKS